MNLAQYLRRVDATYDSDVIPLLLERRQEIYQQLWDETRKQAVRRVIESERAAGNDDGGGDEDAARKEAAALAKLGKTTIFPPDDEVRPDVEDLKRALETLPTRRFVLAEVENKAAQINSGTSKFPVITTRKHYKMRGFQATWVNFLLGVEPKSSAASGTTSEAPAPSPHPVVQQIRPAAIPIPQVPQQSPQVLPRAQSPAVIIPVPPATAGVAVVDNGANTEGRKRELPAEAGGGATPGNKRTRRS